jgi:hypothetical protein
MEIDLVEQQIDCIFLFRFSFGHIQPSLQVSMLWPFTQTLLQVLQIINSRLQATATVQNTRAAINSCAMNSNQAPVLAA